MLLEWFNSKYFSKIIVMPYTYSTLLFSTSIIVFTRLLQLIGFWMTLYPPDHSVKELSPLGGLPYFSTL